MGYEEFVLLTLLVLLTGWQNNAYKILNTTLLETNGDIAGGSSHRRHLQAEAPHVSRMPRGLIGQHD
jgi:hypothetical protein